MEEIKKTVKNAISQGEKYDSELNKINDDIVEYIQSQQRLSSNEADLIPDIDRILDKKVKPSGEPKFQIGQPVSSTWHVNGNSLSFVPSLSNVDNGDAVSIIEDNEHLRQRWVNIFVRFRFSLLSFVYCYF